MKQVFTINSGKSGDPKGQLLAIRIGERHAGYAICSLNHEELFNLTVHTGVDVDVDTLGEIFPDHSALSEFGGVTICFDHPQNALVPQPVYREEDADQLLRHLHPEVSDQLHLTDNVNGWQISNVYAVPEPINSWVRSQFPAAMVHHAHSIGIRSIEATNFEGSLSANFRTDDFELLVSRANKLLLAQTYSYTTPADVIYILLEVCRQFSFSQDTVRVALSGLIEKESSLYRELYQYFINVKFREPSWTVVSADEQPYPSHFFTPFNDLARCVS